MITSLTGRRRGAVAALAVLAAALAVGCGTGSGPAGSSVGAAATSTPAAGESAGSSVGAAATSTPAAGESAGSSVGAAATSTPAAGGTVTLITHDSFSLDKQTIADFEKASGITLKVFAQGDAGAMTTSLVLAKDKPLGDVVYGIDNTFASRALDAGVFAPYAAPAASAGADRFAIDPRHLLTAVDFGDVCVNVDHTWFAARKLAEPRSYEDLAKPEYKDLLVVQSPATSSPGLAFLLGTISHFGADRWQEYWSSLRGNGVKVTADWTSAYTVDFSGSSGKGSRPLVVSYASSPPSEVPKGSSAAPTGALLDTCFRQVEYAGVLAGAANPAGAQRVVDFLLSQQVQRQLPEQMYVYPVDRSVALPADWTRFAPLPPAPVTMDPAAIGRDRQTWIEQWSELMQQ